MTAKAIKYGEKARKRMMRGIDKAVVLLVEELKIMSKPIRDQKDSAQVGTISANNDSAISAVALSQRPWRQRSRLSKGWNSTASN